MGDQRVPVEVSTGIDRTEATVEPSLRYSRMPMVYALVPDTSGGAAAAGRVTEHHAEGKRVPTRPAVEVDHPARRRRISRDRRKAVTVDTREEAQSPGPATQVIAARADADARGRLTAAQKERDVGSP